MHPNAVIDHCDAFLRENADTGIRKPAHDFYRPPATGIGDKAEFDLKDSTLVHYHAGLITRHSSTRVWTAFADLPTLLADTDRLSPRFRIEQLCGLEGAAPGNEYRISLSDPAYRVGLQEACRKLAAMTTGLDVRRMDFRIEKAGPWGGEAAELVLVPLRNHARAGLASLWIVAHPADNGDDLKVTIDCCELSRPAWLPDLIAEHQPWLFDWRAVLNRFSHMIEAVSADDAPFREKQWRIDFTHPLPAQCIEALASHPAVSAILISDQEHAAR